MATKDKEVTAVEVAETEVSAPAEAEVSAPAAKPSEDVVLVKTAELEAITQRLNDLEAIQSQTRLDEQRENSKKTGYQTAFLKVFQGKIVVKWKSEAQKIITNPTTNVPVGEVLQSRYYFIDGTDSGIVDQVLFTRAEDRVAVSIIEDRANTVKVKFDHLVTVDKDLERSFKLPHDLEPYEISKDYINP